MNELIMNNYHKLFHLYTTWTYIFHIFYIGKIINTTYVCALFAKYVGNIIMLIAYIKNELPFYFLILGIVLHELPFLVIDFEPELSYDELIFTLCVYLYMVGVRRIYAAYTSPMKYFIRSY